MNELKRLFEGKFWTKEEEMIRDLENEAYEVLEVFYEDLIVIDAKENDGEEIAIELIRAGDTITMKF